MNTETQKNFDELVKTLDLIPHPEGGFYRETYRSEEMKGKRNLMSCIYFLLSSNDVSHFHRIKSDEMWFFHGGSPLIVHVLDAFGHHEYVLGNDLPKGILPQFLVPKNTIFGSTVLENNSYSLVSCVVSPGFDFSDFELFKQDELMEIYPESKSIIEKLALN